MVIGDIMYNLEAMFAQLVAGNMTPEAVVAVLGPPAQTLVTGLQQKKITPAEAEQTYFARLQAANPASAVERALTTKKKPKDYNYCLSLLYYMLGGLPHVTDIDVEFTFNPEDKEHYQALISLIRALFPMEKPGTDRYNEFLLGQGLREMEVLDVDA
jgi:hypothetical protein